MADAGRMNLTRTSRFAGVIMGLGAVVWSLSTIALLAFGPARLANPTMGFAGLAAGLLWLHFVALSFRKAESKQFGVIRVVQLAALLLPILFVPVAGTWLLVSPSTRSVAFAASWAVVWLVDLVILLFVRCPSCGAAFARGRGRPIPLSRKCGSCGAGPSPAPA